MAVDSVIPMLGWGVVAVLLAVELVLAIASWIETGGPARPNHQTSLLITRSFAIRDHFETRRAQLNALRRQYPLLRLPGYGRHVRDAVRRLHPTQLTATPSTCPECRGSRMRGLPRCPGCARPLIEPAHAVSA
jgi:hypothetical protein